MGPGFQPYSEAVFQVKFILYTVTFVESEILNLEKLKTFAVFRLPEFSVNKHYFQGNICVRLRVFAVLFS